MPREIMWTDSKKSAFNCRKNSPISIRSRSGSPICIKYVTELEGFADDPTKSNESRLEAIQMAWHEEFEDAKG